MSDQPADKDGKVERHGLDRLSEDATGFGVIEVRTAWAVVARPRQALEAWMAGGPTGGGLYARPLRLYLALCGLMMLVLFLQGGMDSMLLKVAPDAAGMLQGPLRQSGKSLDAFLADFDGWASLVLVPVTAATSALFAAPLLRWWDAEDLGWRRSLRATFAYLSAWTVPMLPFTWFAYQPQHAGWTTALMWLLSIAAFLRMGAGRWYRTPLVGVGKGLVMTVALMIAGLIAYGPILVIGGLGALFAP